MSSPQVAPPTALEVTELLRAVMDPELGDNIVDLGMAGEVTVSNEGLVSIAMKLTIKVPTSSANTKRH